MTEVMRLARVRQLSCYVTSIHTLVAYGVSSSHFLLSKVVMVREAKSRRARPLLKVMKSQNEVVALPKIRTNKGKISALEDYID